jgi:hypothetical protein
LNLKVPIVILDELAETVVRSTGSLDLASGEIFDVRYDEDRPGPLGLPATDEQYEFTSGVLSSEGKDVEFRVDVDIMRGQYYVNPSELLELKVRAAKLFAGLDAKALLANSDRAAAAAAAVAAASAAAGAKPAAGAAAGAGAGASAAAPPGAPRTPEADDSAKPSRLH